MKTSVLLIFAPCVLSLSAVATPGQEPLQIKGPRDAPKVDDRGKQSSQNTDRQTLAKRVNEELLAECQRNDRLYKKMVKENPHDIRAWQLLGWNAAYNLSVTSNNANERYAYVRQGIEHLMEGLTHNPTNAALYWDIGFYLHNKIGQSEARKSFRKLFRSDKAFHQLLAGQVDLSGVAGPDGLPDNHLVAQRWFEKTLAIVEKHGRPAEFPKHVPALVLHAYPAMCQRAYAGAIEDDGHFGETAVSAWKQALNMWEALAERALPAEDGKYFLKNNEPARQQINYDYWKKRCLAEQTEPVVTARHAVYRAEEYLRGFNGTQRKTWEDDPAKQRAAFTDEARRQAKQLFDEAFRAWGEVARQHAWLVESDDELPMVIRQYQRHILKGKRLPDDFPLRSFPDLLPRTP